MIALAVFSTRSHPEGFGFIRGNFKLKEAFAAAAPKHYVVLVKPNPGVAIGN